MPHVGKGLKSSVIWGWHSCSETITMTTDCSKEWLAILSAWVLEKIHGAQAILSYLFAMVSPVARATSGT